MTHYITCSGVDRLSIYIYMYKDIHMQEYLTELEQLLPPPRYVPELIPELLQPPSSVPELTEVKEET